MADATIYSQESCDIQFLNIAWFVFFYIYPFKAYIYRLIYYAPLYT